MSKTAQEIAAETLAAHAIRPDWRRTGEQIAPLIAEGIEADRRQGDALRAAALHLAAVARQMYDAEGLGSLQCREAEAIADVCRAVGDDESAECIIAAHGGGDDDWYDEHHDRYLIGEGREDEVAAWEADRDNDFAGAAAEEAEALAEVQRRNDARETAELLRNARGDSERLAKAAAAFDDIAEGRA